MKLSQLKQLIKEEIQNEATIVYGEGYMSDFKKMIELDPNTDMPIIDDFIQWVDLIEWKEESAFYDEDDDSPEAKERTRLANVFFSLRKSNMIYPILASSNEGPDFISLTKQYKNMMTYGDGYEYVRIILTAF
jgi:hypothetical protein